MCSSAADRETGEALLYQERGEFFAIHLGEHGEQVGEAGVGDPHLFAVQHIMLAVGGKLGAGAAVERIRAGGGFRERIGPDNLGGRQPREVFLLLLFGPEVNDRQQANAGVASPTGGKAGVLGNVLGDQGGADFIQVEAAVGLGNLHRAEPQFAGLLH